MLTPLHAVAQMTSEVAVSDLTGSDRMESDRTESGLAAMRGAEPAMGMIETGTVHGLITARRSAGSTTVRDMAMLSSSDGNTSAMSTGISGAAALNASGGKWTSKPGIAFLSSAILPGSAQILNGRTGRGIAYAAIEAATLAIHADQIRKARDKERRYERFANGNWSVVNYAVWLVGYHDMHELSNPYLSELRQVTQGLQPAYDIGVDWPSIPIELLRNVERNTLYVYRMSRGQNTFSHVMPDYGSQQYYELISKYYQYGPGWSDFPADKFVLPWDGSEMSAQFYQGRDQAEAFNDHYRFASNMVSLLIVNHIFSAFDAYFTVKLDASRLKALPPVSSAQMVRFHWAF
jgi:hypothetical protein